MPLKKFPFTSTGIDPRTFRLVAQCLNHHATPRPALHITSRVCSDWLRAGRSGDRIPVGARFYAPVQTGPGSHPASCTMGTGSFPGAKRPGRGADHPPILAPRSRMSRAIPLLPLYTNRGLLKVDLLVFVQTVLSANVFHFGMTSLRLCLTCTYQVTAIINHYLIRHYRMSTFMVRLLLVDVTLFRP
jgi:hypothetical protein